jgi:hypothetical protein
MRGEVDLKKKKKRERKERDLEEGNMLSRWRYTYHGIFIVGFVLPLCVFPGLFKEH